MRGLLVVFQIPVLSALLGCSILPRAWTRQSRFDLSDLDSELPVRQIRAIHFLAESELCRRESDDRRVFLERLHTLAEAGEEVVKKEAVKGAERCARGEI